MNIHGLTVCVNYADLLALGLERWKAGLASWTIVTDTKDEATAALARQHGLRLFQTDLFTANGAAFNKGAAMEAARQEMPWEDWILFLDADVVPSAFWPMVLEAAKPEWGHLYGCRRLDAREAADVDDRRCPMIRDDRVGYGYFQLFHSSDPLVQKRPLLDTHWTHAGNYDSYFLLMWPTVLELDLQLWHVGGLQHNWFGRGERQQFLDMEAERRRRGGGWSSIQHERIKS